MHHTPVVIWNTVRVDHTPCVFLEVVSYACWNIAEVHRNVAIPVRSCLFVVKTNSMSKFVYYYTFLNK